MATSYLDELLERRKKDEEPARAPSEQYVWWLPAPDDGPYDVEMAEKMRASSLIACAQALDTVQREIHEQNLWSAQLYSNRELAAFDWGTGNLTRASMSPITRTAENLALRVVETLVAQVGKNRPKAKPVPRGASWHLRAACKKADKFLYGENLRNRLWSLAKQCYRDACIFSFGCMGITVEDTEDHGARIKYERVFPDEILVDQMEIVATGKIRHMYRRRVLPVEVVAETYGIDEAELASEAVEPFTYVDYRPIGAGYLVVVEGYQLASCGRPGRWVVATNKRILAEKAWEHEWLPYVFYHYQTPTSGFYSPSAVEQVLPYQIRLNEVNEVIRDAQDIMARPRLLVAEGSNVNPMEVDDVIGRFIKYRGIKPEAVTWNAVNAELYNERERCIRVCLEAFGLSNLASTVTPPPGARFDSSPAFREFNAIQDDRLSDGAQRFEEFHLEIAEHTIRVAAASGTNPKTYWYSGWKQSKCEEIEWKDFEEFVDSFTMTIEPVSSFSMTQSAARDELEKQFAMGLITPEQYRLELSNMDTEGFYSLQAAAAEDLLRVQDVLESGDFENPTKEQDLVNGVTQMTLALLQLNKYKDVPDEVRLNFVNWITLAQAIMEQGTEQIAMGASPSAIPVPEAAGLAPAGPGPMPGI